MAQFLDPSVELSLIQQRFPDVVISECGKLISDFFCARKVTSHTYEGRLFLTEKAILFVSTYSDAHVYDICLKFSDVLIVTTFHKSIVPSIEFSLKEKDELFTNFYNLGAVAAALTSLMPGKVLENKSSGSQRKLNRLLSVPARPVHQRSPTPPPSYETVIREEAPVIKAPPCPFFAKCGFCPRQPLCKLHHDSPQDNFLSQRNPGINSNSYHGDSLLLPSKRIHLQDESEATISNVEISPNKKAAKKNITVDVDIEYNRSLSSPARVLTFSQEKGSSDSNQKQPQRSSTDITVVPLHQDSISEITPVACSEETHSKSPSLIVPPNFDFTSDTQGQSPKVQSSSECTETEDQLSKVDGDDINPDNQSDENVFVFTAVSNPSSPEGSQARRRNAGVTFKFPSNDKCVSVSGERLTAVSDEGLAQLTQQLELGSDSDSLHGDLDLDHQKRLLASFTNSDVPPSWTDIKLPHPKPKISGPLNLGGASSAGGSKEGGSKPVEGWSHKRRHCLNFLAGGCPRGSECPEYHGAVPDNYDDLETMINDDEFSMIDIPSKLKVLSAKSLGRSDIDSGDKIILSPHVLFACEQQELSYPMAFKLDYPSNGKTVYAGVLEFTSPHMDHGYLPQWMIDHLGVGEGEEVDFKHVELPKGKFVRLQPVSSAWLGIPYDKRMAMMEFQLRNFQTLTEGTKVTLTYELNRYTLKVLECKPAKGISIVDADITTDIVEPADFNRYHSIEDGQAVNIALDEPTKCTVEENTYRHFVLLSLPGQPLPSRLRVEVQSSKGDGDLFLSQSCAAPSQARYSWCEQKVGESQLCLSTEDKDYDVNKPLYAGVVSLCEETEFTITFHREDTMTAQSDCQGSPSGTASGRSLQDAVPTEETDSGVGQSSETPPTSLPPGQGLCAYCGSVMPALRLLMHERHCAQSTFKCPVCKVCLPKTAEKKHYFIAHEPLTCDCGMESTQLSLHQHQLTDCPKRSVKCPFKWCTLSFPMDQLQIHEHLCGRKRVPCSLCNEEVSQLELEIHLEAFHSVDTSLIDWTKPIASQAAIFKPAEPKFKCSCGSGFDFQDDYQVHQLTECPERVSEDKPKTDTVTHDNSLDNEDGLVG